MSVRYRGPAGQVCTYGARIPQLESDPAWERVDHPTVPPPLVDPPAESAPKGDWEAYAVGVGVDTEGMTKQEIVEACGDL